MELFVRFRISFFDLCCIRIIILRRAGIFAGSWFWFIRIIFLRRARVFSGCWFWCLEEFIPIGQSFTGLGFGLVNSVIKKKTQQILIKSLGHNRKLIAYLNFVLPSQGSAVNLRCPKNRPFII